MFFVRRINLLRFNCNFQSYDCKLNAILSNNVWDMMKCHVSNYTNESSFRGAKSQSYASQSERIRRENDTPFSSLNSDTFGTLTDSKMYQKLDSEYLPDDDDGFDELECQRGKRISLNGYFWMLRPLLRPMHGHRRRPIRLAEALQVFEQMKCTDRIAPFPPIYTMLINGCAKCGYTKKAFELFDELLRYKLYITKATITALFNACAECPFPEYGLEKAKYLREFIHEKGYVCNTLQYHAMIKAFGKCGDLKTAFEIVNEMVKNEQTINSETFAMLLIGCVSDKESGLFHAIRVLRKMRRHNVPFQIYTYNLLLRAVRDCGIGSESNVELLVKEWKRDTNSLRKEYATQKGSKTDLLNNNTFDNLSHKIHDSTKSNSSETNLSVVPQMPNFLLMQQEFNVTTQLINIDYKAFNNPTNRLMLIGGANGLLQLMRRDNVPPEITTFTLLLDLIAFCDDTYLVNQLLKYKVRPDNDFFNCLIKRRCMRGDANGAKEILSLMQSFSLEPDIFTYGVLAIGCKTMSLAKELLQDMDRVGIIPNNEIMRCFVEAACRRHDFWYLCYLIDVMQKLEMSPDPKMIENIEIAKNRVQEKVAAYDRGNVKSIDEKYQNQHFRKGFAQFKLIYDNWIHDVEINSPHPWEHYKVEKVTQGKRGMIQFERTMKGLLNRRMPYEESNDGEDDDVIEDDIR